MKKKTKILILAGLVLFGILYKPVKNRIEIARAPEKILVLGQRVDEYGVNFNRQIKDPEKVTAFENFFDQAVFQQGWEGELEGSDLVSYIIYNEGVYSYWFDIWFEEDGWATVVRSDMDDPDFCKLTEDQTRELKEIVYD